MFRDTESSRIVLHYNRAFGVDPSIKMWVVKHKGVTYYVDHLDSTIRFRTKETPDNTHTKGSVQVVGKLNIAEENGLTVATIF